MVNNINSENLVKVLGDFVASLSDKQKEIITKRYGLDGSSPMTLEAIGQEKQLTRERIRQIEEGALKSLRTNLNDLSSIVEKLKYQLELLGGARRESRLLQETSHSLAENPVTFGRNKKEMAKLQNHIWFILDLAPLFNYLVESRGNHPAWYREKETLKKVDGINKFFKKELKRFGKPIGIEQFHDLLHKSVDELHLPSEQAALSYLDLSKDFGFNPFYEFGLSDWDLIKPSGVGPKAYLVLQKEGKPLHFREISDLINQAGFDDGREARPNTTHNELIKNNDFVLIGRGLYALKEWGYESGTVSDVLVKIIKKIGPKFYRELLEEVKKQRQVQDATVLINLQNKKLFRRTSDGRYALNK